MKKLVLFAAVAFAVSFAACSSKTEEAKAEATVEAVQSELEKDANYAFEGDTLLLPNADETAMDEVIIKD